MVSNLTKNRLLNVSSGTVILLWNCLWRVGMVCIASCVLATNSNTSTLHNTLRCHSAPHTQTDWRCCSLVGCPSSSRGGGNRGSLKTTVLVAKLQRNTLMFRNISILSVSCLSQLWIIYQRRVAEMASNCWMISDQWTVTDMEGSSRNLKEGNVEMRHKYGHF